MKSVLITGAAGYIGAHVTKAFAARGHRVIALDRNPVVGIPGVVAVEREFLTADETVFPEHGTPDVCVHLAWQDGFNHMAPSHIQSLPGHLEFLRRMARAGVKQIAVLGTMHEVGYWEGAIDENTPTNPMSLYGIAKNALRQAAFLELGKQDVILQWLRAYYILGDDRRNKSLFSRIIGWEEEGRKTFPFTSGKNKYDFIDVSTLAEQVAAAASQDEVTGVINCCSGTPTALMDQVETFLKDHNFQIRPEYGAFPDRPYDSPAIWGNADKIKSILALQGAQADA